jgi:hypothetical protein
MVNLSFPIFKKITAGDESASLPFLQSPQRGMAVKIIQFLEFDKERLSPYPKNRRFHSS